MIPEFMASLVEHCSSYINTENGLMFSLLLAGLVGGFSHCAMMCGPFVMAQTGKLEKPSQMLLLPYHLGRITTYTTLAVFLHYVVNLTAFFTTARTLVAAPLLFMAGILFLVNAFPPVMKLFPWASSIRLPIPFQWINKGYQSLLKQSVTSTVKHYLLGIVLGFIPCGLVIAALMASSAANTALDTALSMIFFGIGTMPALILVALGERAIALKYPQKIKYIRSGFLVWSGLLLCALASMMITKG